MLNSIFVNCRRIRSAHWLVPCLVSVLLGFPTDTNQRCRAEDLPEKLGAKDISIGEPLQIPLHSDRESVSVEKELDFKNFDSSSPEELSLPEQNTKKNTDGDQQPEKQAEPATVLSGENVNQKGKNDNDSQNKNGLKTKSGPQGSGWLGLTVDDSIITGRLVIVKVSDPSPAMQAGIQAQDVLLAIDGEPVQTADQLAALLAAIPPDKEVRALIGRTEGVNEVTMTARTRPPESRTPAQVPLPQIADSQGVTPFDNAASRFTQPPTKMTDSSVPRTPPLSLPSATVPQQIASTQSRLTQPSLPSRFSSPGRTQPTPAPQLTPSSTQAFEPPPAIKPSERIQPDMHKGRTALGVRTLPIDLATQTRYRLPSQTGAYVFGVVQSLPAANAGVPPGSVIVAFGNRLVRSPDELNHFVLNTAPGTLVSLQYVLPGGQSMRTDVALQRIDPALEQALIGVPANDSPTEDQNIQIVRRPLPQPTNLKLFQNTPDNTATKPVLIESEIQLLREEVLRLRRRVKVLEQSDNLNKNSQNRKIL